MMFFQYLIYENFILKVTRTPVASYSSFINYLSDLFLYQKKQKYSLHVETYRSSFMKTKQREGILCFTNFFVVCKLFSVFYFITTINATDCIL